jgi:hypothetical protein
MVGFFMVKGVMPLGQQTKEKDLRQEFTRKEKEKEGEKQNSV